METAVTDRPPPTGEGLTFEKVWAMFQETDRKMQETDRIVKENARQMGDLHNRFGEIAEHLVAPGITSRFKELGYHFIDISEGSRKILDDEGKVRAEFDILLENGDCIIAVEVKAKVVHKDIEAHTKRLEILREYRDKRRDTRKIYGAIAGAIFGPADKKAAAEAGFYVLEQSGDTMKMDIPNGFVPREW